MKYARIVNNLVWETFVPHSGATIEECFTPDLVAQFILCPEEVGQNWTYENGIFTAPAASEEIIDVEEVAQTKAIE